MPGASGPLPRVRFREQIWTVLDGQVSDTPATPRSSAAGTPSSMPAGTRTTDRRSREVRLLVCGHGNAIAQGTRRARTTRHTRLDRVIEDSWRLSMRDARDTNAGIRPALVERRAPRQTRDARRRRRSVADVDELGVALCDEVGCEVGMPVLTYPRSSASPSDSPLRSQLGLDEPSALAATSGMSWRRPEYLP